MKPDILIIDANVLIDFCKTDRSVLALVTRHLATVHVAEQVLEEVEELDRATAVALGISVLTVEYVVLSQAATASVGSPLGFQDWLCLLVAQQNSWICVTNDKRLRAECATRGVAVLWGLQLLLQLVERRALGAAAAIRVADAICALNKRMPASVLAAFRRKVRGK